MIRKKRGTAAGKQYILGLTAVIGIVFALWCQSFVSLADSTGTVTASSATIRKETNTNSTALGSVAGGTTVSITDEVQDSSGTLWYQVSVNGQTGYIRSDLVSKTDDAAGSQGGNQMPSGASVEPDTVLDAQYAVVSADKIKVRTAPSTNDGVVENLNRNAQVIVSGESQGNDGKKWYYVTFTGTSGAERSGFIRSDLLSLGEMVPVTEEEVPEIQETEPEPEVVVNYDYELTYEQTSDGSYVWYVYDYTDDEHPNQNVRYPLEELMKATKARSENDAADAKTLVRQRVAIVILVVLLALLAGVTVMMALKLRDIYYEDYEDEDEEEEEEEETPRQRRRRAQEDEDAGTQRRRRAQEDEDAGTQRRRRTQNTEETSARRRRRTEETEEAPTRRRQRMEDSDRKTERPVRRRPARDEIENDMQEVEYREDEVGSIPVKTAQKRKTKNFLLDDDEFEFEFLNMEDKN